MGVREGGVKGATNGETLASLGWRREGVPAPGLLALAAAPSPSLRLTRLVPEVPVAVHAWARTLIGCKADDIDDKN